MAAAKDPLVIEVYISPEMLSAGLEAKREAETLCLTEGEIVREIYYAMYGAGVKCCSEGEEAVH